MKKILLVTHKTFGEALIQNAKRSIEDIRSYIDFIGFQEDEGREDLLKRINDLNTEKYALCFVDMKGGTPANVCLAHFWSNENISIISGVNSKMLVEAIKQIQNDNFIDVKIIERNGKQSIQYMNV